MVYEFLWLEHGIRNLIREGKDGQVYSLIENTRYGESFESVLARRVEEGVLSEADAKRLTTRPRELENKLSLINKDRKGKLKL